ncbi:hypothetical protein NQ314_003101 [Rhamnusium bicolor]|uniref:Aminopeptidase N-like N-terminal domain-containing protein n=1 Tax=Rhamnusium bicolor TaxID=1586634 RepID=A0AAV8ZNA3_9CUCU|nr:hypothetical protein NQ314_003101 [Rhamnusium bicolor]
MKFRIQIIPHLHNLTTTGTVTITLNPVEDTSKIIFHVNNITIIKHSVSVISTKPKSSPITINDQDYVEGQKYRIMLNENLEIGEEYLLGIKFIGELNSHLQGFYRSRYNDEFGRER